MQTLIQATEQALAQVAEIRRLSDQLSAEPDNDDAIGELHALALSQEVRSDWRCLSHVGECEPDEWRIVLCTGGPHVEVRGEFDCFGEPVSAALWFANWGQPLAEVQISTDDASLLLWFAQSFYWGN